MDEDNREKDAVIPGLKVLKAEADVICGREESKSMEVMINTNHRYPLASICQNRFTIKTFS